MPALAAHGIGVRAVALVALDNVCLQVPSGRVAGVIGPHGAGTTTLVNVVRGFVKRNQCTISFNGKPLCSGEESTEEGWCRHP
jgi:ABC-type branched-subunit amino acid transport system ATPase component